MSESIARPSIENMARTNFGIPGLGASSDPTKIDPAALIKEPSGFDPTHFDPSQFGGMGGIGGVGSMFSPITLLLMAAGPASSLLMQAWMMKAFAGAVGKNGKTGPALASNSPEAQLQRFLTNTPEPKASLLSRIPPGVKTGLRVGGTVAGTAIAGHGIYRGSPLEAGAGGALAGYSALGGTAAGAAAAIPFATAAATAATVKMGHDMGSNTGVAVSGIGGALGTAATVATAGAIFGSGVPILGTIAGAVIGGGIGLAIGLWGKDKKETAQTNELADLKKEFHTQVESSGINGKLQEFQALKAGAPGTDSETPEIDFARTFDKKASELSAEDQIKAYKKMVSGALDNQVSGLDQQIQVQQFNSQSQMATTQLEQILGSFSGPLGSNLLGSMSPLGSTQSFLHSNLARALGAPSIFNATGGSFLGKQNLLGAQQPYFASAA